MFKFAIQCVQVLNEITENGIQLYTGQIEEEDDSPEVAEIMVRLIIIMHSPHVCNVSNEIQA